MLSRAKVTQIHSPKVIFWEMAQWGWKQKDADLKFSEEAN